MQIRSGSLALAALMGCLAMQAPVTLCAADAIPAKATKGAMDGLLDLLRDRGILSGAEADEFKRKIEEEKAREVAEAVKKQVGPPPVQVVKNKELPPLKTTLPEEALTGLIDKAGKQQLLTPAEAALVKDRYRKRAEYEKSVAAAKGQRLPEKDLRALVEVMKEQGLVGADEAQELTTRLSSRFEAEESVPVTKDSSAKKSLEKIPQTIITAERQIPYIRSSMPQEDLVALVDKAGKQNVLLPWEVAFVKSRYQKKAGLDQVAEAVSGEVRTEMRAEVNKAAKQEVASAGKSIAAPDWTKRFSFSGDMRLRYEGTFFSHGNYNGVLSPLDLTLTNTTEDRQRFRVRARLNTNVKVNEDVTAVFGLATGNTSNPVSTNQTLGNYFNMKAIQLDKAYIAWKPGDWLTVWGGHFPNPWFYTDLVWDNDLNFDGLAGTFNYRLNPSLRLFLTGGAFPIQEIDFSQRDKWLFGGQFGAEYVKEEQFSAKVGMAYYTYSNMVGKSYSQVDVDNYSSPQFMQKGNSLFNINPLGTTIVPALIADYNELNMTAKLDLGYWHPFHIILGADYVYNLGFDRNAVASRAGKTPGEIAEDVEGYQFSIAAGAPKVREQLDWRAFLAYKRIGSDAVLDAFTDSDFHLGGTNAKGWILGAELGLLKNTSILARWLTSNEIRSTPFSVDLIQVDLNVRF